MVTHMKTTVEIADALLEDAKRVAAHEGTTLRALIEDGLRRAIADRRQKPPFKLRDASVDGTGMSPDLDPDNWQHIRDLAYEGRGA